jgi:O-antigen ligase
MPLTRPLSARVILPMHKDGPKRLKPRAGSLALNELPLLGVLSAASWAVGTNWLGSWWYPIYGLSIGDLLFLSWLGFAFLYPPRRRLLLRGLAGAQVPALLLVLLMGWLVVSMAVNAGRYGARWADLLTVARLLYFITIIAFVKIFVEFYGYWKILAPFLIGICLLLAGRLYDAFFNGAVFVLGLPLLKDPNVIGNMLGIGVFLCSFGILAGRPFRSLALGMLFAGGSILTFSKGSWLMMLLGIFSLVLALLMRFRPTREGLSRLTLAGMLLGGCIGWLLATHFSLLESLVKFKLETTMDNQSGEYRYRFGLTAVQAMLDHPAVGLGLRNYSLVDRLYPSLMPEQSDNAHNAFLNIGAEGGFPALVLLLGLFLYPFQRLSVGLRGACQTGLLVKLYVCVALLVFGLSGAVQLQLIAQPFFWFFTGLCVASTAGNGLVAKPRPLFTWHFRD